MAICSCTFSIVSYSESYCISLINFFNRSFESAYRPNSGVITFVRLSLFILSSKVRACAYFFLPYITDKNNLVDGQNEKSCDLLTYGNNFLFMFTLLIEPCDIFDHFSHTIP